MLGMISLQNVPKPLFIISVAAIFVYSVYYTMHVKGIYSINATDSVIGIFGKEAFHESPFKVSTAKVRYANFYL